MRRVLSPVALCLMLMATAACGQSPAERVEVVKVTRVSAAAVRPTPIPTAPPTPVPTEQVYENSGGRIRPVAVNAKPKPARAVISLPTLGKSAPIFRVGVNSRGEMDTPKNARDVALLDQGPYPGETNNAVLAGHISWKGVKGTFNRISEMNPGDPVVVEAEGFRHTYQVLWKKLVDRDTEDVNYIMGYTEVHSITMITCGGEFDREARTHTSRWVVRAQIVDSQPIG